MKLMKKVLAVALSGVMALSMLTACDGGADVHSLSDEFDKLGYKFTHSSTADAAIQGLDDYWQQLDKIEEQLEKDLAEIKSYDSSLNNGKGGLKDGATDEEEQDYIGAYERADDSLETLKTYKFNENLIVNRNTTYASKLSAFNKAGIKYNNGEITEEEYRDAYEAYAEAYVALPIYGETDFGTDEDAYKDLTAAQLAAAIEDDMSEADECYCYEDDKAPVKPGVDYTFGYAEVQQEIDGKTHYIIAWVVYEN